MKFTISWLKQYIDPGISPQEVADRLTMLGLEVDSVEELFSELGDGVRVAKVRAVEPHPNADKLVLCDVVAGSARYRIVCGAPNVRPGMRSALALPGTTLPSGLVIKKSKIRGEVSDGMLCSEKDLGISEEHMGIMELPDSLGDGEPLVEALTLKDTLIEVDLTPNRPDCASVIGIAREVAGFSGKELILPLQPGMPPVTGRDLPFSVAVETPDDCPRYCARLLKKVTIGPSPWWLKRYLLAVGLRPINNIVDITNYVMLEYGQPLHAFDFDRLAGGKIIVRRAREGEKITTLDSVERQLDPEMLMICDAEHPVAIAGIMGGEGSEVRDETSTILLESAYFDPISIRRTLRKLKMGTDSSFRFERGVDPQGVPVAMERAVQLIIDLAGAEPVPGGVDEGPGVADPPTITLRPKRVSDFLGVDFSANEIAALLNSIQIKVDATDQESLLVYPPSFRVDLEREVDLIEEVARLKGYNALPSTLPLTPMTFPEGDTIRSLRKKVSSLMISMGFYEAINYSFATEQHFEMLMLEENDQQRKTVRLLNPLIEDQSILRTGMLAGLLENCRHNINRQSSDVRLFEVGKVYRSSQSSRPREEERLAAILSGRRHPGSSILHFKADTVDLLDVKGVAENLLEELRIPRLSFDLGISLPFADSGACVGILSDKTAIGCFGMFSSEVLKKFGIKQDVYFLEIELERINELLLLPKNFKPLPKFPWVKWDLAVLVPDRVGAGEMLKAIEESDYPLVERVEIFDVYRGKAIEQGYKSVAFSITYRSHEQTLDDKTVNAVHKKITELIISRFNGKLREV